MDPSPDPRLKKAYEISYALFRVAATLPSRHFAEVIEKESLQLLRSVLASMYAEAKENLRILNYFVSFGKDTGNIPSANGDILLRHISSFVTLIEDSGIGQIAPVDLSDIFSSELLLPSSQKSFSEAHSSPIAGDRQTTILEKIRQSGNCRTRDLQAAMPHVSERTLRYDLQRLVEQGKIERGGGGGPASWYRIREPLITSQPSTISASSASDSRI